MQRKLGLISEDEARQSENRNVLTRSVGQDPMIRVDSEEETVVKADRIVLCSDGLHGYVADSEIADIVSRFPPGQACRRLVALAEERGTHDNVSVQVVQVDSVEEVGYYRGAPIYREAAVPPPTGDVRPGDLLDDRFLILETISRSGMATIHKATDQANKQTVAVKVPLLQFESDPGFYSRFIREEEIGLKLDHPYLLRFIPVEKRSRPYIVTEYLRGYTLAHLLYNVSPLPVRDALTLASRICDAIGYLHEHGVVHRDLKPQNIMICTDGTIRIMDFGIARAGGRRMTFAGFTPALGTPDYMAPEQVKGKRGDPRTDLYSLGAILYEMVTGRTPYEGENPLVVMNARLTGDPPAPRTLQPSLPPTVEEIILHAMERDPAQRYATAAEFKADLDDPERVAVTGRAGRLATAAPWTARLRKRLPVLAALLALVLIALGFAWFAFHAHPSP
jgi:serine/threonine-protein kinase